MEKVLVKLYVPTIEQEFDIKIPLGRNIGSTILLLLKGIKEISKIDYQPNTIPVLYNKNTGNPYDYNIVINDTDIKNGTELILI